MSTPDTEITETRPTESVHSPEANTTLRERQKHKNYLLLGILVGMVVLMFAVTIVKISS